MRKLILIALVALAGSAAQAAYLYWQVDSSDFAGSGIENAQYARVMAVENGSTTATALSLADSVTGEATGNTLIGVGSGKAAVSLDTLRSSTAYSFYIELVNYNSTAQTFDIVGHSETSTYQSMVNSNYIDTGDSLQMPSVNVWHGGSYVIPEPTSALLVMIGVGLLGLKRRRV